MTVESIVDIKIGASDFTKFAALWEKYQTELKKQPELWKKITQAQHGATSEMEKQAQNLQAQRELAITNKSHDDLQFKRLGQSEQLWRQISTHGSSLYTNVLGISSQFMKWGGLGLKAFGIGAGAVAGAYAYQDKIANTVAGQRQAAQGFGTNIGQLTAFNTAFGPYLGGDASGLLGYIATGERDITRQKWFRYITGHNMTGDTSNDSRELINKTRAWELQMKATGQGNLIGTFASNLGSPFDTASLNRMLAARNPDFAASDALYDRLARSTNIPDATALAAQNFATKIKGDLQQISTAWHQDAIKMMPAMGRLADSFTNFAVRSLQGAGAVMAGYAGRQDFLAHPTMAKFNAIAAQSDRVFGLPAGTLEMIKQRESGNLLANVPASRAGALGVMQLMSGTAKSLGVNPNDPLQSLWGAGTLMNRLMREFNNNLAESLAAYNWGEGNVKRDIAQHGVAWQRYLPKETQNYIAGVPAGSVGFQGLAAGAITVNLKVTNATGSDLNWALNGLAGY